MINDNDNFIIQVFKYLFEIVLTSMSIIIFIIIIIMTVKVQL